MKKIIYISLLASILFSCNNESESKMSIKKIDDKNYYPHAINENAEKAQIKQEFHENGRIKYEWNYVNDKKEGISKGYWIDGSLRYEENYVNGRKEGMSKVYYGGGLAGNPLANEKNYVNGRKEGISKVYYRSGELKREENYVNDRKEGISKEYDRNGQLKHEHNYVNDSKKWSKTYYKGHFICEKNYINGGKDGVSKKYFGGTLINAIIAIIHPNANKDSLVGTIDSAIFLFFNDVAPMPGHDELKKIEQERYRVLKSIDNSIPEEGWGDGSDYYQNCEGIQSSYYRLSELSFGKEKESALRRVLDFSDCSFDETYNFTYNLNVLCELLKLQIHQQYPIKKTLKDINDLYIHSEGLIEYILDYDEGEEIIYLRRLLDLYYSGELNKHIIFQEKASVSDTVISNKVQFSAEEKNILSNLLSESSIVKLEQALYTLYNTDKDWEVIQSFIELAAIKDSLNLLINDEDEEFGINEISRLEKSDIWFKNCHVFAEYQCGYTISFDVYSERASTTSGKADDDFFDFLSAHSEGALHDNDKFGAWMAGADFYRTWFLGHNISSEHDGDFLNYFKKETGFIKKYEIYDASFTDLSTENIKGLKNIIETIHKDAIDYLFYDPRIEDDMGVCCKEAVIEELNQILVAKVLSESESKKLKIHIEDLSNDNSPWLQWSFDNE